MIRIGPRSRTVSTTVLACLAGSAFGDGQPQFGAADNERQSSIVQTIGMQAVFLARSTGAGKTRVTAQLEVVSTGPIIGVWKIDLNGGDRLIAKSVDPETLEETEKVMTAGAFGSIDTVYGAGFRGREKDKILELLFDRSASGYASSGVSSTTLPSPFELDWVEDPVAMTSAPRFFSRSSATPYFVVWDPFDAPDFEPGDQLLFQVTGKCIEPYSGVVDWEAGEDTLALTGVLQDVSPPRGDGSCPVRVEITLRRTGTVDAAYEGGSFYGEQVRILELRSKP